MGCKSSKVTIYVTEDKVRVIRSLVDTGRPKFKYGIEDKIPILNPIVYSETKFVIPSNWSSKKWPKILSSLSYRIIECEWGDKKSSEIVSFIKEKYSKDEDLIKLSEFILLEKQNNRNVFILRNENK